MKKLRVLIADDSSLVRDILDDALSRFPDVEVVGHAGDGLKAERMVSELRPDVVSMDVLMPLKNGLEALEGIMLNCPTPVVIVADAQGDARGLALEALGRGAVEVYAKPMTGFDEAAGEELYQTLRRAAQAGPRPIASAARPALGLSGLPNHLRIEAVGIAGSTGSPNTVRAALAALPPDFPAPIALVQHTSPGFTAALVDWLAKGTALRVLTAVDGTRFSAGAVYVAPDEAHLSIEAGGFLRVQSGPLVDGHRPSGTVLLHSIAMAYRGRAVGVVLSGMGRDGAAGLGSIDQKGGIALVESQESAVVGGMPREAALRAKKAIAISGASLGAALCTLTRSRSA